MNTTHPDPVAAKKLREAIIHIKEDGPGMICGMAHPLPEGHVFFFATEHAARSSNCTKCNPVGAHHVGTPVSQLSGRRGQKGYQRFCEIASSWGH